MSKLNKYNKNKNIIMKVISSNLVINKLCNYQIWEK